MGLRSNTNRRGTGQKLQKAAPTSVNRGNGKNQPPVTPQRKRITNGQQRKK